MVLVGMTRIAAENCQRERPVVMHAGFMSSFTMERLAGTGGRF